VGSQKRREPINRFGDTKRYATDDLPEPDYVKVFARKIEILKQYITKDAGTYTDLRAPNCYENTLVIVRLLARLNNAGQSLSYGKLKQDFKSLGYHQKAVEAAFEKVSKFGLVTSSEGFRVEDWTNDTEISASTATKAYLEILIVEPSYLQYVSEDVPMPDEFIVPIRDKYKNTLIGSGGKDPRLNSVRLLIDFIESEEKLEKEAILKKKRFDEDNFLGKYGIKSDGTYLWLAGYLRKSVEWRLQRVAPTNS